MARRRFDHLALEIALATGAPVPRYQLWLALHEQGFDPEDLTSRTALAFCAGPLESFLAARGLRLSRRSARRLRRAVERYDPALPAPEERMVLS